jgi:hypothetical protein
MRCSATSATKPPAFDAGVGEAGGDARAADDVGDDHADDDDDDDDDDDGAPMTEANASPADAQFALQQAVQAAVGATLDDKDVTAIDAVEGGLLEVVRRGRRERLQVVVEGPLFALLRERGAELDVVNATLAGGARLVAAPLADGRIAVAVHKAAPTDVRFEHLVEEGLLPPGIGEELVAAVLEGQGVAVVGPARTGRVRIAAAVARALASVVRCAALGVDVPAGCRPAPGIAHLVARARTAVALGADVVIGLDLTVREAADLAANTPGAPVVAAIAAPSVPVLVGAAGDKVLPALFPLIAVVGFTPDGRPRLLELHGGQGTAGSAPSTPATATTTTATTTTSAVALTATSTGPTTTAQPATAPLPAPVSRAMPAAVPPVAPPLLPGDEVVLGEAPPADWASADADDDPGWELGSLAADGEPPVPGSFDAALAVAARRPSFTPRSPSAHPSMHALRGTGGLTFEPPPGGGDDTDR